MTRRTAIALLTAPGLTSIVSEALRNEGLLTSVRLLDDSFLVGSSPRDSAAVRKKGYVKSAFDVLGDVPCGDLEQAIHEFSRTLSNAAGTRLGGVFRVRVHDRGQFVSSKDLPVRRLERAIARTFGGRPEARGGAREYWVVRRRDHDHIYLLTQVPHRRGTRPKGSLSPEVASAMVSLVPDNFRARAIDPFCGSGSIAQAMLEAGYKTVWANDIDPGALDSTVVDTTRVIATSDDFADTVRLGRFSSIITDPPWGHFDDALDVTLWRRLAAYAEEVLVDGGWLVVLTAREIAPSFRQWAEGVIAWDSDIDVLVQGHRATVVRGSRLGT